MNVTRINKHVLAGALVLFMGLFPGRGFAKGSDVSFRGTVTEIQSLAGLRAIVKVRIAGYDLPVSISDATEIQAFGHRVALSGLQTNNFVEVSGFFATSGIAAKEIRILDSSSREIRLQGEITELQPMDDRLLLTVHGIRMEVRRETEIRRDDSVSALGFAELRAGMQIEAAGDFMDDRLIVRSVHVGERTENEVRFEGTVLSLEGQQLLISTGSGGVAVVLITSTTEVRGSLAEGELVEVQGKLNPQLQVVAAEIHNENENEIGDDNGGNATNNGNGTTVTPPAPFVQEIRLSGELTGTRIAGSAERELEADSSLKQKLDVRVEKGPAQTAFRILVTLSSGAMIDFGSMTTDGSGKARMRFRSDPGDGDLDIDALLPAGTSVVDFAKVQILLMDNTVVLEGRF